MRLTVNGMAVEVEPGATLLTAARAAGVDVPTICRDDACAPSTSCMACLVRVDGGERLLPACEAPAREGMRVETEDEAVLSARRMALELLLSDHTGDCEGPCRVACPASLRIPELLRASQREDMSTAYALVEADLVLPATLGAICPAPCEKVCRRARHDEAIAIRALHRGVALTEGGESPSPPPSPSTGRQVAIIGAGPTGLAAARDLCRAGHAVTVYESAARAGGALVASVPATRLPAASLAADLAPIQALPIVWRFDEAITDGAALRSVATVHDAVLLAWGARSDAARFDLPTTEQGVCVERSTGRVVAAPDEESGKDASKGAGDPWAGLFAAGAAVQAMPRMAVRAVAEGKRVALVVDRFLRGEALAPDPRPINVRMGQVTPEEMALFLRHANPEARSLEPTEAYAIESGDGAEGRAWSTARAAGEAARCLRCDCRAAADCRLRDVATRLGASVAAYDAPRRPFQRDDSHPDILYESGKCIACGLCIQVAEGRGEPLGETWIGRGFKMRIGPAFGESVAHALTISGADCVRVCPTGALAFRD